MSFIQELKRRNVGKTAVLYVVFSWLLLQVTDVITGLIPVPDWTGRLVLLLLVLGFIPALIISWIYELTPEGVKQDSDVDATQATPSQSSHRMNRIIVALLLIAIAVVAVDRWVPSEEATPQAVQTVGEPDTTTAGSPEPSIAVLPFENFSGQQQDDYFSDGLSDTVLHQLAQVPGLKVIARNSTFQFKGSNLDVREVGRKLGAANVLEGSVQRYGQQVRVIAQLVRTSDGAHSWSQSFDYRMDNIFELHDAIARAVTEQMKLTLLGEDLEKLSQGGTDNPAAYEALIRADALKDASFSTQLPSQHPDVESYPPVAGIRKALQLDPTYVDAMIKLGDVYNQFAWQTNDMIRYQQYIESASALIPTVIKLAPDYAAAWEFKGSIEYRSGNLPEARKSLQKAISLNPNLAQAYFQLALVSQGEPEKVLEYMARFHELDPEQTFDRPSIFALLSLGKEQEALQRWQRALDDPDQRELTLLDLGSAYQVLFGKPDVSATWASQLLAESPNSAKAALRLSAAWHLTGEYSRAQAWLDKADAASGVTDFSRIQRFRLMIAMGDLEAALALVDTINESPYLKGVRKNILRAQACLAQQRPDCALAATTQLRIGFSIARERDALVSDLAGMVAILEAAALDLAGQDATAASSLVLAIEQGKPRTSWDYEGTYYRDVEAHTLQGDYASAVTLLAETLLADEGYLATDSLSVPADQSPLLSRLADTPGYDQWLAEFQRRREAARQRMLAMEASASLPRAD